MEHQHFIPRSYLKNFARLERGKRGTKAFVSVCELGQKEEKPMSTKDICVRRNLYTLPEHSDDRFVLEKHYAENIDNEFPEIYSLLTSSATKQISRNQKRKIINILLSLYFRTPKFLDLINKMTDAFIERALLQTQGNIITIQLQGSDPIVFEREDVLSIKSKIKEENRLANLRTQLSGWENFVRFKSKALIGICKIEGDVELITCDNPVLIRTPLGEPFNLWNPANAIHINLDPRHFVYIAPNDLVEGDPSAIYHQRRTREFAITNNYDCIRNASKWLIGKSGTIIKAIEAIEDFNSERPESLLAEELFLDKMSYMTKVADLANQYGPLHPIVINEFRAIKEMDLFKDDPMLRDMVRNYRSKGIII